MTKDAEWLLKKFLEDRRKRHNENFRELIRTNGKLTKEEQDAQPAGSTRTRAV
jgi:hypothetical protein